MINVVGELIEKHSDEEIIAYLEKLLSAILQNYQTALKVNQSEILWANFGDLRQAVSVLKGLKKRNEAREAQKES